MWEDRYDQARGHIGQIVSDRLQEHIEVKDNPIEVWKTLASLFDKSDDIFVYYLEKKIHELDPKYFDTIQSFLA